MADDNDTQRETHEEVFGPKHAPERGLVHRTGKVEKDIAPLVGFFRGALWPLRIIGLGLVSAFTGAIVNLIRMWLGGK